eukprot:5911660-Lingulodinium_polyedra.AAC.1
MSAIGARHCKSDNLLPIPCHIVQTLDDVEHLHVQLWPRAAKLPGLRDLIAVGGIVRTRLSPTKLPA